MKFSDFRFRRGGVSQLLAGFTLIAILFAAGCTTSSGGGATAQFAVTTTKLPAGSVTAGAAYPSTALAAANGTAPYTWAVTSGNLPPGLALSTSGTISGTPTTAGTYSFTVTATDSSTPAKTTTGNLSITINAALAVSTTGTLSPVGEAGGAYPSTSVAASGGVAPYTFAMNSGNLPGGLSLSPSGSISGTISSSATPGNFTFTVKATDSQGGTAVSGTLTITVDPQLTITAPTLATGVVNVNYSASAFTAGGGSGSGYTFALASGSLPAPLTLGGSTGLISAGPPTASGTFTFTVKVTDSLGFTATTSSLSLTINPAITVALSPTGPVTLDEGKTQAVTANVTNDPSSAGVNWSAVTGLGTLSGSTTTGTTYNAPASVTTASQATFTATSKTDPTKSATFTVNLIPLPQITTTTMPAGNLNGAYNATVTETGGVGPYTWSIVTAPAGLTLSSSTSNTVTVQGAPTVAGNNQTFTIKVTDAQGLSATSTGLTITVYPTLVITTPTLPLPIGVVNVSYPAAQTFTASGGSGAYTAWAVVPANPLPAGLSLSPASGATTSITGTPTASGTLSFKVKVTDSVGNVATTAAISITINPAISMKLLPPGPVTLDQGKTQTVQAAVSNDPNNAGVNWSAVTGLGTLTGSTTTQTTYNAPATVTVASTASFIATSVTDPTKSLTFTVNLVPAPQITTTTMPAGNLNGAYNATVTETGGVGPYVWAIVSAPAGLTLSASTGSTVTVQGAPTVAGNNQTFTIKVTDAQGLSATSTGLTITVYPTLSITTPTLPLPTGVVGVNYPASETFTAAGGSGTGYTWSVVAGNPLPPGLNLSAASGTTTSLTAGPPTTAGTYPFAIKLTDSVGNAATTSGLSITINPPISVGFTPASPLTMDQNTTQLVTANVSNDPNNAGVTWSALTGLGTLTGSAATTITYNAPATVSANSSATFTATSVTDPTKSATFTVNLVTPPAIGSVSFSAGTVGTAYNTTVTEAGGVGPFTWLATALPTGMSLSSSTTSSVVVQGTPTSAGASQTVTIKVTDAKGLSNTLNSTVTINPAVTCTNNCQISGSVTGAWGQDVTITLTGQGTGSTATSASGAYSFTGLTPGNYVITPSLAGYQYNPTSISVDVVGNTTGQNFVATSGMTSYSISGTISYAGAKTGNTILRVYQSGCTGCGVVGGTSFPNAPSSSGTSYIIRGLQPTNGGNGYTVQAEIDTLGTGITNESNPEGTSSTVTLPSANATGINFTIADRTPSSPTMPSQNGFHVAPSNQSAVIQYQPLIDNNGEEIATSYNVYYGTDSNASNGVGSPANFKAQGNNTNVLILNQTHSLVNGGTYFFKITAKNSVSESAATTPVSAVIGAASGAGTFSVSGTVTFTGITATGPLYAGVYGNNGVYVDVIPSPTSGVSYTITGVPPGTYQNFAIIDMNNDGEIDTGDINNVNNHSNPPTVTVSSSNLTGKNLTLTSYTAAPAVTTFVQGSSGQANSYGLNVQLNNETKLPVSMTLFSGNNVAVPFDTSGDEHNANFSPIYNNSASPNVGDAYQFLVTFSDGTTSVISAPITAVLSSSFPGNLQMNSPVAGSVTPATLPVLNWTAPTTAPTLTPYTYSVNLNSTNNSFPENWNYSGPKNGNGIPSSTTNVAYNTDGNANPNSALVAGVTYNWSVTVQDNDNNSAQYSTSYTVPGGTIQSPTINVAFNPTSIAVSGISTLTFTINNPNGSSSLSGIAFTDNFTGGLQVTGASSSNNCGGTFTGTGVGSTSLSLSNAGLSGGGSCQISIQVTSNTTGTINNTTGNISSNEAGTGATSNTASLAVGGSGILPPTIGLAFNPATITVNFSTTLAFTINNPNGANTLSGVGFTDSLPSNLFVLSPNNGLTGSCGSGTITATAGSSTISLSGGTLGAGGSCSFSVNVTATATGTINDTTGSITSTEGGTGGTSNTASLTVNPASGSPVPTVDISVPGPAPLQAGQLGQTFSVSVNNDESGDAPSVTSFTLNGAACTASTCGTFAAVQGTAGSGSYTVVYTPPASLASEISPTVTVTPSISAPFFAGTTSFNVYPSGLVVVGPGGGVVQAGPTTKTLTYTVYNDVSNQGVNLTLLASGYACQSLTTNSCGSISKTSSASGTTTTTTVTYTPPASVPAEPYDRPLIVATSAAQTSQSVSTQILISSSAAPSPLSIPFNEKLDSALTNGAGITLSANGDDPGSTMTVTWTITANGTACAAPTCGTLGTPTVITNGSNVLSEVTYTPPATVPTGSGQSSPTITASFTDNSSASDSFNFNIVDGTCGSGNNGVLKGDYAFLVRGGGAKRGYDAEIGSFVADGSGNITSGFLDVNRTYGPLTGLTLTGTYSVGSDNRGCLNLTDSSGKETTYRIALGTLSGSPSTATQGSMVAFIDNTGQGIRNEGILLQQNTGAFNPSAFNGTYVFGREGVDVGGGRFAIAGLVTANGVNALSNISADYDDAFTGATNIPGPDSGTFSLATNAAGGRGTSQSTISGVVDNFVLYVVSASEVLTMSTDPIDTNHAIQSGIVKLQTGPFTATSLDNNGYVLYVTGIDNSNGGNNIGVGQAKVTTSGAATLTLDQNDNGTESAESVGSQTFSVSSTGRTTLSGGGGKNPIFYLVDSTQGFAVGTDSNGFSGYIQRQTGTPFSNTTVPATAFFNAGAPNTGSEFDSGSVTLNTVTLVLSGTDDGSSPSGANCGQNCNGNGLDSNSSISNNGQPIGYSFTAFSNSKATFSPTAAGQGIVGSNGGLAYQVTPTKIIFMQIGATSGFGGFTPSSAQSSNNPELFVVQQ